MQRVTPNTQQAFKVDLAKKVIGNSAFCQHPFHNCPAFFASLFLLDCGLVT